ncbi:MAG TPA: adenosyl-hopene transferase HpnH [Candidatus Acidoferrum sp.]|nr:adenosyl-hopene transferase HpnH [Candidatus Acidoferrum sp.]
MRYPLGLVLDSARYLASRKLRGDKKIPVMLSLDPLGGCAKKCGANGNGSESIEERAMLTVEQCLGAMEECDAPVVAIRGGEPLDYPEIARLTLEILERGKHLFLCTDGTLIRRRLHMIPPYTNFFWNVKMDGTEAAHDARANRPGLFLEALDGVKAAKNAGFFVVVTTTIYPDTDVRDVAGLCEKLHAMHVDGYMLSPHYPAEKMCRNTAAAFHEKMQKRFREASELLSEYNLLTSPIYMEYLRGERELDCCSWGSPVYGPRGWAAPCSQLGYGYEEHYKSLLENTVWENFGRGMNPQCEPCASHSGYETAAILGMNPKTGDFWKMVAWQLEGGLGEKRERARKG